MEAQFNKHEGWTNYETWATFEWLSEGKERDYCLELAYECRKKATSMTEAERMHCAPEMAALGNMAYRLRDRYAAVTGIAPAYSLARVFLDAARRRVNWWEIADYWLSYRD